MSHKGNDYWIDKYLDEQCPQINDKEFLKSLKNKQPLVSNDDLIYNASVLSICLLIGFLMVLIVVFINL